MNKADLRGNELLFLILFEIGEEGTPRPIISNIRHNFSANELASATVQSFEHQKWNPLYLLHGCTQHASLAQSAPSIWSGGGRQVACRPQSASRNKDQPGISRILLRPRMRRIQAYLRKNSNSACLVTIESVCASPILFGEERLSPSNEKARRSWSFNCDRITRKHLGVMKRWPQHCQQRHSTPVPPHQAGFQHSVGKTQSSPTCTPNRPRVNLSLLLEHSCYVQDKFSSPHSTILSTLEGQSTTGGNNDGRDRSIKRRLDRPCSNQDCRRLLR